MSQGMVKDPDYVLKVFREHSEDLLYNRSVRDAEEKSLFDQYEEIKDHRPHIVMGVDKRSGEKVARVTGL